MSYKKQKPLLYIQQPNLQLPKGNMQKVFSSRKHNSNENIQESTEQELDKKPKQENKNKSRGVTQKSFEFLKEEPEVVESETIIVDEEATDKPRYSMQRVKSFKEMDIPEKLRYLEGFPKQLPSVPCQFKTKDEIYKGFLSALKEGELDVTLFNKSLVTISIDDLVELKMLGHMS